MSKEIALKNLREFYQILNSVLIYPVILDGGTLLGAYRDRDFCEDDWDDVDLTTFASQWGKTERLTAELEKVGFTLYHSWPPQDKKSGQVAYKKDGCKIDLMFKEIKDEKVWWCVYKGGGKVVYKAVPLYFYAELEDIKFYDLLFSRPKLINEYLQKRYGNWPVKVHRKNYSCYTTDKCIVNGFDKI